MGIIERIRTALSPRARLLNQLAETAGQYETLATKLKRHAEECAFPNIRAGLERLATAEGTHAKMLHDLLLENGVWPRVPDARIHDGSSNWERLQLDLKLQMRLLRELNLLIPEWAGIDPVLAEWLRALAIEEDQNLGELRDLTLKCDPQALD